MIEVKVLYFGMLAESVSKDQEMFKTESKGDVKILKREILNKYPALESMNFQIAVNKKLHMNSFHAKDEIALLAPFAGG